MAFLNNPILILQAKRTPIGAFQGQLSSFKAWELGAQVIKAAALDFVQPEEVIMGCVLSAGQGQAPARQATRLAFENDSIPTTTINKVCGSSLQAIALCCGLILSKQRHVMIAGGFESMTNAPYLLTKGRGGYRAGHSLIFDHMQLDGLEDAYAIGADEKRQPMGVFADLTAEKYGFTRKDQELFAKQTFDNFQSAENSGAFTDERISLTFTDAKGNLTVIKGDEPPTRVKPEKFEHLRPAFGKTGTVTAATSSGIADGAAALLLSSEEFYNETSSTLTPLARVVGFNSYATSPEWFTIAPVGAIQGLLNDLDWTVNDVDLFEVNEAFAVVPIAAAQDLGIDRSKMNVHGGACSLGHPIGASGARIVVTLIHALRSRGLKRGIASACIGGGEAIAIAIESC